MDRRSKFYCFKILRCFFYPLTRFRKISFRSKKTQIKLFNVLLIVPPCFAMWLLYYWDLLTLPNLSPPSTVKMATDTTTRGMVHVPLDIIYPDMSRHYPNESLELDDTKPVQMLDTPGCQIPLSMIDYRKHKKTQNNSKAICGKRAVILKKVDKNKVRAEIKSKIMKTYLRKSYTYKCRYRFFNENKGVNKFTRFITFNDSDIITLNSDFIHVRCFDSNKQNIYDDVYAFANRINVSKQNYCKLKYNVLMIGMHSMSLPRFSISMTRTVNTMKDNYWLGYRAYHKVADNTLPNIMAVLTGKNTTTLEKLCSGKMNECQKFIIWDKFKTAGYVTAFGEDYLRLPETFSGNFAFKTPPTHHYLRPLFQEETENGNLICTGKLCSGQQILNYALDFANTYRYDQFFGLFWINSYSHDENSRPEDADVIFDNFLNELSYTNLLYNTFFIVFSDHGLRFGEQRLKVQSYYDDRMPFLFIWTPLRFKVREPLKLKSLMTNQFRLVTPFDLYNTLVDISEISTCSNKSVQVSKSCPNCHSLFEVVSEYRTCQDVGITVKWCSCHKLYPLSVQDIEGQKSVDTVVSKINSRLKLIQTKRCWTCMDISVQNIERIHFYYNEDKVSLFYVVAFTVAPTNVSYEATVLLKDGNREVIEPISIISPHQGLGQCTVYVTRDTYSCKCEKKENC